MSAASQELRARAADDTGSMLPLVAFFGALALLLVLIVASVTSLYMERKRLLTLADGAALVGAESFTLDEVTMTPRGPRVELQPSEVRNSVQSYLSGNPIGRFDGLTLVSATTHDSRSATVTVSSIWHPPVVTIFVPKGMRIEATATSRTVFH